MKFEREIKYTETINVEELPNSYFISGSFGEFLCRKTEFDNFKAQNPDPFSFVNQLNRYYLYSPEFVKVIQTRGMCDDVYTFLRNPQKVDLTQMKDSDIEQNTFSWDMSSHLLYGLYSDLPITRAYYQDYCGGLDNNLFDLDKAETILRLREQEGIVWGIRRVKIPDYNASEQRTEGLEFFWRLPQFEYDKQVLLCQREHGMVWSTMLKTVNPILSTHRDILGLRPALNPDPAPELIFREN